MQVAHVAGLIRGLSLFGCTCAALAQAPAAPPADASTPLPAAAPAARPALTLAEPASGRPPGRLIALPVLPDGQLRELAVDVATHLILNAQIAQYFFIGQHYYMYFVQENARALKSFEAALRTDEMKPLLEGVTLP